jgi:hypothetical protein
MIFTEAEAAQKVCVHVPPDPDGVFRVCVASRCMQWRWEASRPRPGERVGEFIQEPLSGKGFCGLAGKP